MAFRLRTIEFTADGRKIVRDRDIAATSLSIGRSAENDIHLPDLAVEPVHAVLEDCGGGRLAARASGTLGFGFDGKTGQAAEFDVRTGGELRFGTWRITVTADADGTPLLTVQQAEDDEGELDEKRAFSLAHVLPGKRWVSWVLAVFVLLAFMALPIASSLMHDPVAKQPVIGDGAWSSGRLSLAHHGLEDQCEACHVKPFQAVRDETCLSCHKTVHDHASPDRIAHARGSLPLGSQFLWGVAHTFGKPGPGACSDCHTEHEGTGRMEPARQEFCADCHGTLKDRLADTKLGNAADFGHLHPQFRPAVALSVGSKTVTRVSLDARPREASGLTFPHKLHLDPRSGVARMAASIGAERGYGAGGMECSDCHHVTSDGVRFQPIEMERDCGACHSLAYDEVGGIVRKLRHGDVNQMIADLSATPVRSHPIVTGRHRPGEFASGGAYFASFSAPVGTAGLAARALSRDGICGECHTPDFSGGRFGVMKVTQVTRFMAHGWFDHDAHKQETCTSCHAANASTTSADLLLPDLKSCRTCHMGEGDRKADVPSSCSMCHSYHLTAQAPKGARPMKK